MCKFLKLVFKIIFLSLTIIVLFDCVITIGLRNSKSLHFKNLSKIHNGKINADILISGSSKSYVQISPKVIDSLIGYNSYNISLDGNTFDSQYVLFKKYVKNNGLPKTIIHEINPGTLSKKGIEDELFLFEKFLPYLQDKDIYNLLRNRKSAPNYVFNFNFSRYFGQHLLIIDGLISFLGFDLSSPKLYKGYFPKELNWSDEMFNNFLKQKALISKIKFDNFFQEEFYEYINFCKMNNIELILVSTPIYGISDNEDFTNFYKNVAKEFDLLFLDYTDSKLFILDKSNFYDSEHLNKNASDLFSVILTKDIQNFSKNY